MYPLVHSVTKKNILTLDNPPPPEYMVVTRELEFIFLYAVTCQLHSTEYNFKSNLFLKTWILTALVWNCPLL